MLSMSPFSILINYILYTAVVESDLYIYNISAIHSPVMYNIMLFKCQREHDSLFA